jgi:hypothetical protein
MLDSPRVLFCQHRLGHLVPVVMTTSRLQDGIGFSLRQLPVKEAVVVFGATTSTVIGVTLPAASFLQVLMSATPSLSARVCL